MLDNQDNLKRVIKELKELIDARYGKPYRLFEELEDEIRKLNFSLENSDWAIEKMEEREKKKEIEYEAMKICYNDLLKFIGDKVLKND
tara:strand:+ start:2284 stop:2547 length:264 start_codon:yes stop_codon:yes gene_type:complete